jgi:outer membrane receptor for ferrienterochelin and colicins
MSVRVRRSIRYDGVRPIRLWIGIVALVGLLAATGTAGAQSIDYGSLEKLFGEPITTSVTGSPQRASDVPADMEIITADDIRRSGATDIPGVLRHVAGVDVWQWTTDESDIGIRGSNQALTPRLLVMIDGRQVYSDIYGYVPWSTLPVELADIRQIEIVKGPATALFGFNAAGGVINIVTYNPLYDNVNTVSMIGGTQNLAQGSAVSTTKLGSVGAVRLSIGGNHNDGFGTPLPTAGLGSPTLGHDRSAVDADTFLRLASNVQLRIEASHIQAAQSDVLPNYIFGAFHYGGESLLGQLTSDTDYGLIQATAYSNWLRTKAIAPGLVGTVDASNQVSVFQLQDIFKPAPDHTLRATIEYRHNTMNTTPISGGNVFYGDAAVGGMWSWAITPTVTLTNAVRVDYLSLGRNGTFPTGFTLTNSQWNRTITQPSFNSGVVWKPNATDTFRLTAAQGAQLPSLVQFGGVVQQGGVSTTTGVPTLQPETVLNYELGWDHLFPSFGTQFRASIFHQESHNLLDIAGGFVTMSGIPVPVPINAGHSTANGIELGLKGAFWKHWRWGVNYRLEQIDDFFPTGLSSTSTYIDFENTVPHHVVKANLGWASGPWEIDGYLTYQSQTLQFFSPSTTSVTLVPVNDWVSLDGRIGYKLNERFTFALSGQNLATSMQHQTSGPQVERRVFGSVTINF